MNTEQINRINELYHKSKTIGLTEAEAAEQQKLRKEYILAIRQSLRGTLDNVSFVNEDGSVTPVTKNENGIVK